MNLAIRIMTPADFDDADRILGSAFRTTDSRKPDLHRYLALQPDGWLVAAVDGKLVGTVGAVDFGAFAYIGLMAVEPTQQRQGIARALMQNLLAWIEKRGCPVSLLDASPYGAPLYAQLGFVPEEPTLVFQREQPTRFPELSAHVRHITQEDIPSLVAFDTPIFGASRANVFNVYLADFPDRAFLARDEHGCVAGFVFAQPHRIGPWVANNADDSENLMRAALSLDYTGNAGVIVPAANRAASNLLTRYGFHFVRAQTHMRRGATYPERRSELIYGQASFAIG